MILTVILLINLTYIQAFQTKELAENPLNARQFYDMKQRQRGQISAGGQVLAESVRDDKGYYNRRYVYAPEAFGSEEGYFSERTGAAGLEARHNTILSDEEDNHTTCRSQHKQPR